MKALEDLDNPNSLGSQINNIQIKIDQLRDQTDAEDKLLAVQKARAEWERAQTKKLLVFDKGWLGN